MLSTLVTATVPFVKTNGQGRAYLLVLEILVTFWVAKTSESVISYFYHLFLLAIIDTTEGFSFKIICSYILEDVQFVSAYWCLGLYAIPGCCLLDQRQWSRLLVSVFNSTKKYVFTQATQWSPREHIPLVKIICWFVLWLVMVWVLDVNSCFVFNVAGTGSVHYAPDCICLILFPPQDGAS